jgi:hypothetical protein
MSFFIARLKKDPVINEFLQETRERGSQALLDLSVQLVNKEEFSFWVNIIKVRIPKIYLLSFIFLILYIIFGGWGWLIPLCFFGLTYIVYSRTFHVWAFKRALRKEGYTGTIEILDLEEGLLEVYLK